jgi:hypothetical protein
MNLSSKAAKDKKLILAPSDLVSKVMEISNREGKTLFNFVAEALEQTLRAAEMNRTIKEIVDFYRAMETQKSSGAVIVPIEAFTYLINKLYLTDRKNLLKKWYESGEWYGKYLLAKFHDGDPVEGFRDLLSVSQWDVNEVSFTKDNDNVRIKCVSPLLPLENTELLMKFTEGVMHSFGYEVENEDYARGMILLTFGKSKETDKDKNMKNE